VLAISVDGLNPRAITELGPAGAPTFHRLMREGAYTLDARTEREQTRTLPNHTGMLTGRRIDASRGGHGVTYNTDIGRSRTVHSSAGEYVSSVFDVVHDHGGQTALFATKTKFALYQRTWNTNGGRDRVGADDGREKIDRFVVDTDDAQLVAKLNTYLEGQPGEFVFLHIALPDEIGHKDGFMSDRYLAGVRTTDELLGTVLDTISTRPALRRDTVVLLTADHGGDGESHSNQRRIANYQIPFMAWGPGVPAGRDLYSLNEDRRDPGTTRTTYEGPQPIRNGEIANLSTDVLGLPKVPGSEFDADQDLVIFAS
jgi:predicted AlkP superfamily pyrophosphatase or phosphodiesterase